METNKFNNIREILYIDSICVNTNIDVNLHECKHNVTYINKINEKKTELYFGSDILLMTLLFNFNNYDIDHFVEHENVLKNNNMYDKLNENIYKPQNSHPDPIHVKPMDIKTFDEEYELLNKLYEQSKKK